MTVTSLLGAGASCDAGAPTSAALTEGVRGRLSDPGMLALFDFVSSGVSMQAATRYFSAGRAAMSTIEDIANAVAALVARDASDLSPFVAAWHPLLTDVDNASEVPTSAASRVASLLQRQFRLAAEGSTDTINTDWLSLARDLVAAVNTPKVTGRVLGALASELPRLTKEVLEERIDASRVGYLEPLLTLAGPRGPASIGTLNYDTTVEMCAAASGRPFDDGLSRWLDAATAVDPTAARILKVHGSISWERDAAGHYRPADLTVDNREPAIIFGGRNKLTAVGPFMSLLWEWKSDLMASDGLLVVGYSFRDEHINAIVEEWIRRPSAAGPKRLVVVDPNIGDPCTDFAQKVWDCASGQGPADWPPDLKVVTLSDFAATGIRAGVAEVV